jgi:membrane protease YdiL (CAAX protease family)
MSTVSTRKRAVIALLLLVPVPSLGAVMGLWVAPGPLGKAVYFICKLWILALPGAWLLLVENGRPSLSPARKGGFGFAVGSGLLIGAFILAAYYFFAAPGIDPRHLRELAAANGFDRAPIYVAFAAYFTFVNAVLEEYVWRWFVFTGAAGVFAGGAVWSWCYLRYRSIWPGYVSHAIVDAAILAIGWDLLFSSS